MDRSGYRTRKLALADEGQGDDLSLTTPGERVEMVWPLTVQEALEQKR